MLGGFTELMIKEVYFIQVITNGLVYDFVADSSTTIKQQDNG